MPTKRVLAPVVLLLAGTLAACGTGTAPSAAGSADTTAPSPSAAAAASADTSASGSPAASVDASAGASADASAGASGSPAASDVAAASGSPAASGDTGGTTGGGTDLVGTIPTTIGDVALSATEANAETYITANVSRQLTPVLTVLGKTPADVTVATATGSAVGGATLFIDAVRIDGTDAETLLGAFQTAATAVPGGQVEAGDVGGKSVVTVTTGSYTQSVYATGDTIYYVQSPDADLVEQAVTALP